VLVSGRRQRESSLATLDEAARLCDKRGRARRLLNGEIDESATMQWLQKHAVMEPARAQQRVKFIQRYRSYVINYNLGEDMVRRYIEKRSGPDPEKRWSEFAKLLSSPRLPSGLQEN
jgi:hypothetical protein